MVTSEAVPFAKSGGLADVATSLSVALGSLQHDVRLMLPLYGLVDDEEFERLSLSVTVDIAHATHTVKFLSRSYEGITVYLVDHPYFRTRGGIYGETSHTPYNDNLLRFVLFSKAVAELVKALKWKVDILHAHDWTTGFLTSVIANDPFFKHTKTVYTIHNLAYQGEFPPLDFLLTNLTYSESMFRGKGPKKKVNMMAHALETFDALTTVSPSYAKEIQTEEQGCSLDGILRSRSEDLSGILNGIDLHAWDPETDPLISFNYSHSDMSGKWKNKESLQKRFHLKVDPSIPVIGMISRIAEQKGFVELLQGSPSTLEQILTDFPIQMVVVGTGDAALEEKLITLSELHDNLSVQLIFSNEAAHLVEAGSDFFFMPSRYEPCGLNQMYSLRYGTIPIARKTGGLGDSIVDIKNGDGTGILFDELSGVSMYEAIKRAVVLYTQGVEPISSIRKRGMAVDFSWLNSADMYIRVYQELLKR
ncbi:MAG: glycogen synthase [Sphaerochaetaceae bacterium]